MAAKANQELVVYPALHFDCAAAKRNDDQIALPNKFLHSAKPTSVLAGYSGRLQCQEPGPATAARQLRQSGLPGSPSLLLLLPALLLLLSRLLSALCRVLWIWLRADHLRGTRGVLLWGAPASPLSPEPSSAWRVAKTPRKRRDPLGAFPRRLFVLQCAF